MPVKLTLIQIDVVNLRMNAYDSLNTTSRGTKYLQLFQNQNRCDQNTNRRMASIFCNDTVSCASHFKFGGIPDQIYYRSSTPKIGMSRTDIVSIGYGMNDISPLGSRASGSGMGSESSSGAGTPSLYLSDNFQASTTINSQLSKYRLLPCRTFITTGACPYFDKCVFLHDPRVALDCRIVQRGGKVIITLNMLTIF